MTNACPNALSLAVIAVISSCIIGTQALADRKLQTRSIDILVNGHKEFTNSEIMVRPTLGHDKQPIPKSVTTTYPAVDRISINPDRPSLTFTQILSGLNGDASIVDLFETDENNVAQKYTKILKVGNEGVFRFTHNLEETELVIEVRAGMTDQDSVDAVSAYHWVDDAEALEPLTKSAAPLGLVGLLEAVYERTGNLGASNHYVALATIEVEKVAVNGRTFMRLIASGDHPPELQRLDQSLFINDDALLAAATSAYYQVHVAGKDLQQQALNELLAHSKPVGYVVHADDDAKVYPVPAGYPKLEVTEAPGEVIVFHGQMPKPDDIAFVESLYNLWKEAEANDLALAPAVAAKVVRHDVKSYRYVIRSRQMTILEEFVARHEAEVHEDQPMTLTNEDKLAMRALVDYEYLQQALASAGAARSTDLSKFEFTMEHIRVASAVITPPWMQTQLVEHFGFRPAFRNLLINLHFVQNLQNLIPFFKDINYAQTGPLEKDKKFAAQVIGDMAKQLLKKLDKLQEEENKLLGIRNNLKDTLEQVYVSRKEKLKAQCQYRKIEDKLAKLHVELEDLENLKLKRLLEVRQVPNPETKVHIIRTEPTKAINAQMAAELGIDNWDDTLPLNEQFTLIEKKINEIYRSMAATEQPDEETLTAEPTAIASWRGIAPINKINPRTLLFIQKRLQQNIIRPEQEVSERLTIFENYLGLVPENKDDLNARHQAIHRHLRQQATEIVQQPFQDQQQEARQTPELEQLVRDTRAGAIKARNAQLAAELGIDDWDDALPLEEQARLIRNKIQEINPSVTEQSEEETVKAKTAGIGNKDCFILVNEDELAALEAQLGIVPDKEDDLKARHERLLENFEQHAELKNRLQKLQQQADQVPDLERILLTVRKIARKTHYAYTAAKLGIDDWDDTLPLDEQFTLIQKIINEIYRSMAATGQPDEETLAAEPTAIGGWRGIAPVNKINPRTLLFIQQRLQQNIIRPEQEVLERLTIFENYLGLVPENKDDLNARHQAIAQHLKQQATEIVQQPFQDQQQEARQTPELEQLVQDARADAIKARNAQLAAELGIDDWDDAQPPEEQARLIRERIAEVNPFLAATPDEDAVKAKLVAIESEHGITPNNENNPDARHQFLQQHPQPGSTSKETGKDAEIKARYAIIAAHLNIENFDSNTDKDAQHERLIQRLNTMEAQLQRQRQQLYIMALEQDSENSYTMARKNALAAVPDVDLTEDKTLKDRAGLELTIRSKLFRLRDLEKELDDIRTPGHPKATPVVLGKLLAVEKALEMNPPSEEQDQYQRRQAISDDIKSQIADARQRAEEKALSLLAAIEQVFDINVNEDDDRVARLVRVRARLGGDDVSKQMLDEIVNILWQDDTLVMMKNFKPVVESPHKSITLPDEKKGRQEWLDLIARRLTYKVEEVDQRAREQQNRLLAAVEYNLEIYPSVYIAARERGKVFTTELASVLQVKFEHDVSLSDLKDALTARIQAIRDEVNEVYDDEAVKRIRNNQIAHQLNIWDYKGHERIDDQNGLINAKLQWLDEEVFKAGQPDVNERISAIEDELDRQMARLGPKPRYVLDREVAGARRALKAAESELETAHRKLDAMGRKQWLSAQSPADLQHPSDEDDPADNQPVKKIQIELGLPAGDEQTDADRLLMIENFLLEQSAEIRDEVLKELRVRTHLNIQMHPNPESVGEGECIMSIEYNSDSHGRDTTDEIDEARDGLPLTGKKFAQVTEFLREHDRKSKDLAEAITEEAVARKNLVRKEQEIFARANTVPKEPEMFESENINEQSTSSNKLEWDLLSSALDQKREAVSEAEKALADHHEATLDATEEALGLKPAPSGTHEQRINALRNTQRQLGVNDRRIRQPIQELVRHGRLKAEIKVRKADIERLKKVLEAAEEAVNNDDGPFQYTPEQVKVLDAIQRFTQNPLKKQALEAAMVLAEATTLSGKPMPLLTAFDFDDEFASIRLQAMAGDALTFDETRQIVEVFRNLKTSFPQSPDEPAGYRTLNVLEEVHRLVQLSRQEIETGAQEYDEEIRDMGSADSHYVQHESGDLKGFSEYLNTRSASGNKIIALLQEGLISKVELENYIKAVRFVEGYPTVAEFEHFLGYKHGVNVPHFKAVVQMLSDKGVEKFMQSAITPVSITATGPAGMKESVAGMKEYAAAVIANYVLDDIAFDNGRRTAAFLTNVQDTLTPYANAAGLSESDLIKVVHGTLKQAHAAAVERQLSDFWVKPSASLVQAVTWYYSSYKPLLTTTDSRNAAKLSLSGMSYLYLLDLTNRGDYLHRMLIPFQRWLQHYGIDPERTGQYAYHSGIEQISEVGGLAMPLGKAASSVILLRTGSMLFARQHSANPQMYRSISRLVPEIVKSMGSGQGVQVPLLHRVTPQKVKTLASVTASLVLGPVATVGAYAQGLISGFTYAQSFGFALASSLTFDFFMNDNKMLTQWLGGPLGRSLDKINRWTGVGETTDDYVKRTTIARPQHSDETDEAYANLVKANNTLYGWTRHENYLQFRERRDRTMKLFENGWEKYFRENLPKWSFSHAESIPYIYTLGTFYDWQQGNNKKAPAGEKTNAPQSSFLPAASADSLN
ncbi:hypothetical protein [Endozoicomonas sp. ALB032]|uniref:hypothetical protein n=1 Tax=Endozoicomonas sp. ALB032 TaxID=3403082 RepID=UPI003BB77BBF